MRAPDSVEELLERARALGGRTVADLAAEHELAVPPDQRRAKGFVGTLLERALGATAGSTDAPDFEALGVELKTLPVDRGGKPRESTFVCSIDLTTIADTEWAGSRVQRKLAHVLWMPIEAEPDVALGERRVGIAIEWKPNAAQAKVLRQDWDELAGLLGRGEIERVTAHLGKALQVRPKAAHSRVRGRAPEADGGWVTAVPRGFYLRTWFTQAIVAEALRVSGD